MVKPKVDPKKIALIVQVLAKHPEGAWIRRIAREAKLNPTTVTKYLEGPMAPLVEASALGEPDKRPLFKVVRLKSTILERLQQGQKLGDIIRLMDLLGRVTKG